MPVSALAAFFASGFAALLYQIVWQRMLGIFSGADVQSATIVVAAFMAGLGAGSLGGGYVADRLSRTASLALFAAAEISVALFGLASNSLFYGVLYERIGRLGLGLAPTAAVLFVALLWPTFCMGMSLPLLARGVTRDVDRAASTVGWLYGVNTLGAALGALCATWWFLPQAGLGGSLEVAATLNVVCAAIAVSLVVRRRVYPNASGAGPVAVVPDPQTANTPRAGSAEGRTFGLGVWAALFGLSGFIALSLEIVWFRLLGVMLKSTSFTFGTLLGLYLAGLGLGAAAGSAAAGRIRRPAIGFLLLQAGVGVYAALSMTVFVAGLGVWPSLQQFSTYFGAYEALDISAAVVQLQGALLGSARAPGPPALLSDFLHLYLLLPAVLVGPPTLMAGFSFPLLQRVVQTDLARLGRRVGLMLAANILGSTLGAFVTGWALLDVLGTAGTLKTLVALSAVFGVLGIRLSMGSRRTRNRFAAYAATVLLAGGVVTAVPNGRTLWARLHGAPVNRILVGEDRSGVSVLKADRPDFRRVAVFVNGRGSSWIPYGDVHTILGALPAFIHPHPRSAALIGLGSGDSLFAMAGRSDLEHMVSIEIIHPQLETLRTFAQQGYPGLIGILQDRRIEYVSGDGRLYLRQAGRKYDIIEADALYPNAAYSGNLYSETYFELLRDHLNPGGLAVSWVPTDRSARTFLKVFPYVWQRGQFMIGSNAAIAFDPQRVAERLSDRHVIDYFTISGVNIQTLLAPYITGDGTMFDPSFDRAGLLDIDTDLYPRDEFDIPPLVSREMFGWRGSGSGASP